VNRKPSTSPLVFPPLTPRIYISCRFYFHRDRFRKVISPSRGNSSFRTVAACCSPPVCPALLHLIPSRYLLSWCMDGMGRMSTIYRPSTVLRLCSMPIHVQMALQRHMLWSKSSPHLGKRCSIMQQLRIFLAHPQLLSNAHYAKFSILWKRTERSMVICGSSISW